MPDKTEHLMPAEQFLRFCNLESYLFDIVRQRFANDGHLNASDFFCIVIWKANRAKSKIAKKLLAASEGMTLDEVVVQLSTGIASQETPKAKLHFLINGRNSFSLPMATAILSVLYPEEFTIYDYRVVRIAWPV